MQKYEELVQQLNTAIGGEWKSTDPMMPVQGYRADFPKFRCDAIVCVINDAAGRAGLNGRAVAFGRGGEMPDEPCEVVIPRELVEDKGFRFWLNADMKQVITQVVSQQLSYAAATQSWLHR